VADNIIIKTRPSKWICRIFSYKLC
jgi:hypothetical protein